MSSNTILIHNLVFTYHNPNYTYPNNYKVKYYYINKTNNETNKYNSNFKLLSRHNIDYDRYKLFTFINNNQITNNQITNN